MRGGLCMRCRGLRGVGGAGVLGAWAGNASGYVTTVIRLDVNNEWVFWEDVRGRCVSADRPGTTYLQRSQAVKRKLGV